jgi:hypothetical protein
MKLHRRRRRVRAAALGLAACAALAAPAGALAQPVHDPVTPTPQVNIADTPADYPGMPGAPVPKTGDTPADYPGMPGAPAQSEPPHAAPTPAPQAGGFDWPSAAIGAAAAAVLIVVSLGGVSMLSRHRTRIAR